MRGTFAVRMILVGGCATAIAACALFGGFDDLEGAATSDGGATDATPIVDTGSDAIALPDAGPPPASGFAIAVLPVHVTEDPGDSVPVQVAISRAVSFTSDVTVVVKNLPAGVTATPLVISSSSSSGSFNIAMSADAGVTDNDITLTVDGSNAAGAESASTTFVLRLGSVLLPLDGGVFATPSYATSIIAKAWGAGGGAGGPTGNSGGGGGFASATFAITGGQNFYFDVGNGGTTNFSGAGGGGGGGLSGIRKGSTYVLIAGGGGGAGYSQITGETGLNGGGGGGISGQQGANISFKNADFTYTNMTGGGGGSQTAGGVAGAEAPDAGVSVFASGSAGAALKGGDVGVGATVAGGPIGGGKGGAVYVVALSTTFGGGGGGGGFFGGGSGADNNTSSSYTNWISGGGGGSGFVDSSALTSSLMGAIGANPPNTSDPDYVAGVAVGGKIGVAGGPGLVVIRLAKP